MTQNLSTLLESVTGFDWDKANTDKLWIRHHVITEEVEQVFGNPPFLFFYDTKHSQTEDRYAIYGKTNTNRRLCIIFTFRGTLIRPLSARGFHKEELQKYRSRKAA